ncbi:MAG TPA: Smr/MutS family protein [Rhizomicrobium sp.]|nr:Smr/MutS family protein [Rhizomicrobium sp.]
MSRKASDEERALFEEAAKNPNGYAPKASLTPKTKKPVSKTAGLDGNTQERLRKGILAPQASLDLHGLTEDAAHRALTRFLRDAAARKLRLVAIVTGKGKKSSAPDEPFVMNYERRGVLKEMTPRWLSEPELARFIADVRPAHRKHGGEGALYVYLRKPRNS